MTASHFDISCARFPRSALPAIAALRCTGGVHILLDGDVAWLRWPAGREEVLRHVWPLPRVELFVEREGTWHRFGHHLPFFDMPDWGRAKPLQDVLFPAPFTVELVPTPSAAPVMVQLVPDAEPRPTTAMQCKLTALRRCLQTITVFRLENWSAARCGEEVLVRGTDLPWLPEATRFWGKHVLVPLGYRLAPNVPEDVLRQALAADEDKLLVFHAEHVERIPLDAFTPLTRAAVQAR